jgi:hypothetical protein
MSSKPSHNDDSPDYPGVMPDAKVVDPNPGNMAQVHGMDGPSNVDVPADPASASAKIEANRNPSNAKLDGEPEPTSEVAKAGFSQRPDGSDNPARVRPADGTTAGEVKAAPSQKANDPNRPDGGKPLGDKK